MLHVAPALRAGVVWQRAVYYENREVKHQARYGRSQKHLAQSVGSMATLTTVNDVSVHKVLHVHTTWKLSGAAGEGSG